MSVAQAEAIAKTVPGLKHVVLWRGLIDLSRDIPNSDVDLLALRNRLLVRKELHPALQYLLLQAMREVHSAPGPFNRLGEFPAEQPNDLPLSATAEAFYRSGPLFWQTIHVLLDQFPSQPDRVLYHSCTRSVDFLSLDSHCPFTDGYTFVPNRDLAILRSFRLFHVAFITTRERHVARSDLNLQLSLK